MAKCWLCDKDMIESDPDKTAKVSICMSCKSRYNWHNNINQIMKGGI